MPHLQDDSSTENHRRKTSVGPVNGTDSSSSRTESPPIQFAKPNFLGSSDPVVAMAKQVSISIADACFNSARDNQCPSSSSPTSHQLAKNVITPTSSIGNISNASTNDIPATEAEPTSLVKNISGGMLTTVYSNSGLSHSPIRVMRRVSQIEEENPSLTSEKQQNPQHDSGKFTFLKTETTLSSSEASPSINREHAPCRPPGKRIIDALTSDEEPLIVKSKKAKSEDKKSSTVGEDPSTDTRSLVLAPAFEARVDASITTNRRETKPVVSPTLPEGKDEKPTNRIPDPNLVTGNHPHHMLHPGFHPSHAIAPPFLPPPVPFGSHPYGHAAGYPMVYPGYPIHAHPGTLPPSMIGQFHGHPTAEFYAPYPPGFHAHPAHQHNRQTFTHYVPPYSHVVGAAHSTSKKDPNTDTDNKDNKNVQMNVMPSNCLPGSVGKPLSTNRCIPLQGPIPSKHWGKTEPTKNIVLPDFHRLVNFPDYLSKSRSQVAAESGSKANGGKKHCVMCGKLRICSASSLMEKGRAAVDNSDGTAHIIPRQNKGLCTACDVTVWVMVENGLEIKWCKGCKNFRQWAAFGDKGSATKCVRCRERQREKYAMQKNAKRARRAIAKGVVTREISSSPLSPSTSSKKNISALEERDETHFAAARGLTSLMNAAAAL